MPIGQQQQQQQQPLDSNSDSTSRQQLQSVAPLGGTTGVNSLAPSLFDSILNGALTLGSDLNDGQQMSLGANQQASPSFKQEFRIITSNSHIQVLENGSMIIKDVELQDASRYSCQASNGIQPILSEVIDLQVLQPAQFDVNFETISVKRGSTVKFACSPRGDQPIRIEWFKEGSKLVRLDESQAPALASQSNKYTETVQVEQPNQISQSAGLTSRQQANATVTMVPTRRHQLVLVGGNGNHLGRSNQNANEPVDPAVDFAAGMVASELLISSADRSDTGAFVCLARNSFGKDELTYKLIVQEPPDAPNNLQLQSVQANSLKLLWQSPFDGNLAIGHFVIEYKQIDSQSVNSLVVDQSGASGGGSSRVASQSGSEANDWMRLVVSNDQATRHMSLEPKSYVFGQQQTASATISSPVITMHNVVLKHLNPKSTYQIRVAAVNPLGQGLFSPIQLISTAEEAPQTRPSDFRAQPISSSSIRLTWRAPLTLSADEPAPIRGYHVSYRHAATASDMATSLGTTITPNANWLSTLSISASNYTATTGPDSGDQSSSVATQSGASRIKSQPTMVSYELVLTGLTKNAKYEIRLQPFNSMGLGPASEIVGHTLRFDRPNQPQLRLVEARKQSLELKWSMPTMNGPESGQIELLGFSLYYKCEYDDWQEIQLALIYHYVIENLRCGNKYQIYLSAFNSVGRSDPSDVLPVRTEGSTPIAPDKASFFKPNITEVVLDMSRWSSGGCSITSFMIQFKRLHDTNWFILSEAAAPFTQADRITIPDLTPATWYKLLVTALNEAGSTNAEYVFGTLALDGQQLEMPSYLLEHQQHASQQADLKQPIKTLSLLYSGFIQLFGGNSKTHHHHHQQQDNQLLLPLSCILLLLVTSLASYLYYNRATSKAASLTHKQKCHGNQTTGNEGTPNGYRNATGTNHQLRSIATPAHLQLMDRHLLHAHCNGASNCLTSSDTSSSSSSASMSHHHGQHFHQHATLSRSANDSEKQLIQTNSLSVASKSKLLPLDASSNSGSILKRNSFDQFTTSHSSPQSCMERELQQQQQQQGTMLSSANFVLESFLDQRVPPLAINADQTQTSSFVCPVSAATLQHNYQNQLPKADDLNNVRVATMKVLPRSQQRANDSTRSNNSYCLEGPGSSSMSSSGLGSVVTSSSGQSKNYQIFDQLQQQNQQQIDDFDVANCEIQQNQWAQLLAEQRASLPTQQHGLELIDDCNLAVERRSVLPSSTSFASAVELISKQQRQLQSDEPIYQRLDKFKVCALPTCRQFATLNPHFAMKRHEDYTKHQQPNYSLDDQLIGPPYDPSMGTGNTSSTLYFSRQAQPQHPPPPPDPIDFPCNLEQINEQQAPGDLIRVDPCANECQDSSNYGRVANQEEYAQ